MKFFSINFLLIFVILVLFDKSLQHKGRKITSSNVDKLPASEIRDLQKYIWFKLFKKCNKCLFSGNSISKKSVNEIAKLAETATAPSGKKDKKLEDLIREFKSTPSVTNLVQLRNYSEPKFRHAFNREMQKLNSPFVEGCKAKYPLESRIRGLCKQIYSGKGDQTKVSDLIASLEELDKEKLDFVNKDLSNLNLKLKLGYQVERADVVGVEDFVELPMESAFIEFLEQTTEFQEEELFHYDFFADVREEE